MKNKRTIERQKRERELMLKAAKHRLDNYVKHYYPELSIAVPQQVYTNAWKEHGIVYGK